MPYRLILALALSFALHGAVLVPDLVKRLPTTQPRPALQAMLRIPPTPEPPRAESLLKNTLDGETAPEAVEPTLPKPVEAARKPEPKAAPKNAQKRDIEIAQRKLFEHQFYPPEAIAQNLEGEVVLIIKFSDNGEVEDVSVAASSGHAILDNAAVRNVYAVGSSLGITSREWVISMPFRLE